jgi:hypothetical protein
VVVVVVVVGGGAAVVVGAGATEIVVGALESGAPSVSGSVAAVEDGEQPEATRTMAARTAKLFVETPRSRRTRSPYVPAQPSQHWPEYRHSMHQSGRNSPQLNRWLRTVAPTNNDWASSLYRLVTVAA